jgi:hypothetical protein
MIATFFVIKRGVASPERTYTVDIPPQILSEMPDYFKERL